MSALAREPRLEYLRRAGVKPHAFEPVFRRRQKGRDVFVCAFPRCGLNRSHIAHDADIRDAS